MNGRYLEGRYRDKTEILSRNLPEGTEKNNEKPQSEQSVYRRDSNILSHE